MGLLDITPEMTRVNEYTQTELEEYLFRLGFRTQYGLNYWFVDVPCTFEKFLQVDIRISVNYCNWGDTIKVRLTPTNLRRGFEQTFKWGSVTGNFVWVNTSICHSPEEIEIEYLESISALMTEESAKDWFTKRTAELYIDFPERTSFLSRYKIQ